MPALGLVVGAIPGMGGRVVLWIEQGLWSQTGRVPKPASDPSQPVTSSYVASSSGFGFFIHKMRIITAVLKAVRIQ